MRSCASVFDAQVVGVGRLRKATTMLAREDVVSIFDVGDANQADTDRGLAAFVARAGGGREELETIETQRDYGLHLGRSRPTGLPSALAGGQ